MCSRYWSLLVSFSCPNCGAENADADLQTHFMGDVGSCVNYYKLGEPVEELQGVTVLLDGRIDDFIGDCPTCNVFIDFGAEIVDGTVRRVWPLRWEKPRATLVSTTV